MSAAAVTAGLAGGLTAIVGWELLAGLERVSLLRALAALIAPAQAAGSDGRGAQVAERRRLTLLAAAVATLVGWSLLGAAPALLLAACSPLAALLLIRTRQRRWRARVNHDAAPAARAIAAALSSGRSLSAAIGSAASEGAVCEETRAALAEVAASIAIGLSPDDALDAMRLRCAPTDWPRPIGWTVTTTLTERPTRLSISASRPETSDAAKAPSNRARPPSRRARRRRLTPPAQSPRADHARQPTQAHQQGDIRRPKH